MNAFDINAFGKEHREVSTIERHEPGKCDIHGEQ